MSDLSELAEAFTMNVELTKPMSDTTIESEWVIKGYQGCMTHCKLCGQKALYDCHGNLILSAFCPKCGARMNNLWDIFNAIYHE